MSVIETDCNVDFEAPKDYIDGSKTNKDIESKEDENLIENGETPTENNDVDDDDDFYAFVGKANRIDGKLVQNTKDPVKVDRSTENKSHNLIFDQKKDYDIKSSVKEKGIKHGKLISGKGNRLQEKLDKDNNSKLNISESQQQANKNHAKESKDFRAFSGNAFSLKK